MELWDNDHFPIIPFHGHFPIIPFHGNFPIIPFHGHVPIIPIILIFEKKIVLSEYLFYLYK